MAKHATPSTIDPAIEIGSALESYYDTGWKQADMWATRTGVLFALADSLLTALIYAEGKEYQIRYARERLTDIAYQSGLAERCDNLIRD